MKKQIADTIGWVAGALISESDKAWPDCKTNVWKLIHDPNIDAVITGFYILESLLVSAPGHFEE